MACGLSDAWGGGGGLCLFTGRVFLHVLDFRIKVKFVSLLL